MRNSHFPLEKPFLTLPRSCQQMKFILNTWPSTIKGLSMLGLVMNAVEGCTCSYPVWTTSRMRVKEEKVLYGLSHEIIRETEFNLLVADKTQWRGILNYSNTSGLRRRFGGGHPSSGEAGEINTQSVCSGSCREPTL